MGYIVATGILIILFINWYFYSSPVNEYFTAKSNEIAYSNIPFTP